jgi:uroporphyrinogen decarboxylase
MKFVSLVPSGVLENAVRLVGYEQLCLMVHDDPALVEDVFAEVGKRLVRYQEIVSANPYVGACLCNDDWGHRTQTLLSPEHHRKYVIPWHKKMIDAIHKNGKPAILHSCGNLEKVMEDIIAIGFDAKHSFEDTICPIEEMYDRWSSRIAIIGGIDVDFLCRKPPDEVKARCRAMLARAAKGGGGYALGTGNSVPEYVPDERYCAMTSVAFEEDD